MTPSRIGGCNIRYQRMSGYKAGKSVVRKVFFFGHV